ncbi:MAG: hypothetical protein NVSMB12_03380 [Acidimicrobiales bacterium]
MAAVAALGVFATAGFSARYTVRPGDTLSAIAGRAGTSVSDLLNANHLTDPNRIYAGQTLLIDGRPPVIEAQPATGGGYPALLQRHPDRLSLLPSFRHWAAVSGVPADLLEAITWMESGWQNGVVSSTGAIGIGQIEPGTARFINQMLGAQLDPRRPDDNIRMAAAYLAWILRHTGGRVDTALAGYYQGIASVIRRGLMPETRHYVQVIELLRPQFGPG